MAITVVFSTSQVSGAPSEIVITDSSTGSDVTATSRRVFIVNSAGEYITESGVTAASAYTTWPIADGNTLTLDILTADAALDITLMYVNVSGVSVAEDTALSGFTLYNETFYYSLTQAQALPNVPPPTILQDSRYYINKLILRTNIDSGNQAVTLGSDITSAQACYDLATWMVQNQGDYF